MDSSRGAGASSSEEIQDPIPMEGDDGLMLVGVRRRNASKRKRSEPGEGQGAEVLGRMTELYLNGDAGNKMGKHIKPPTKKMKMVGTKIIITSGNVTPPPRPYPTESEPGNLNPQPQANGTGDVTPPPRPHPTEGGPGNDNPRQHDNPSPGVRGYEVSKIKSIFETMNNKNILKRQGDAGPPTAPPPTQHYTVRIAIEKIEQNTKKSSKIPRTNPPGPTQQRQQGPGQQDRPRGHTGNGLYQEPPRREAEGDTQGRQERGDQTQPQHEGLGDGGHAQRTEVTTKENENSKNKKPKNP